MKSAPWTSPVFRHRGKPVPPYLRVNVYKAFPH